MSFVFTASKGRRMKSNPGDPGLVASLPAISEAESDQRVSRTSSTFIRPRDAPPIPPRAINRPPETHFALGRPPRYHDKSPPPYGTHPEVDEGPFDGERGEKLAELRRGVANNKHIAKRGGWKRLAIIAIIATICIVALVVGLVVGLRNRSHNSGGSGTTGGASGSGSTSSNATFPAGSYSIDTYLSSVSTNCTSNSATWRCYPFVTYAQNPSASNATFDWIITPVEGTTNNYTISSTDNYFSVLFNNAALSLQSAGDSDEHYYFQTTIQMTTKPVTQLSSENVAATCYFNQTLLEGYLYTKMARTYPSAVNSSGSSSSQAFGAWPYAVKVQEIATSGSGTPTCLDPSGNSLGDFSVQQSGEDCQCSYLNTGT